MTLGARPRSGADHDPGCARVPGRRRRVVADRHSRHPAPAGPAALRRRPLRRSADGVPAGACAPTSRACACRRGRASCSRRCGRARSARRATKASGCGRSVPTTRRCSPSTATPCGRPGCSKRRPSAYARAVCAPRRTRPAAHNGLARVLSARGQYQEALSHATTAVGLDPRRGRLPPHARQRPRARSAGTTRPPWRWAASSTCCRKARGQPRRRGRRPS